MMMMSVNKDRRSIVSKQMLYPCLVVAGKGVYILGYIARPIARERSGVT